jgi:hypothetical protein
MSFEQLIELIAHARRIQTVSDSHGEVMRAKASVRQYERIAVQCGYNIYELREKSRDRFLDLVYATN